MKSCRLVIEITNLTPYHHYPWIGFITQHSGQIPHDNETLSIFTMGEQGFVSLGASLLLLAHKLTANVLAVVP
jgi:hypothetical protein